MPTLKPKSEPPRPPKPESFYFSPASPPSGDRAELVQQFMAKGINQEAAEKDADHMLFLRKIYAKSRRRRAAGYGISIRNESGSLRYRGNVKTEEEEAAAFNRVIEALDGVVMPDDAFDEEQ